MKNRLGNKKGFTLIEIVVVIVIIAILAAILVPAMLKWIDKGKIASATSEADTVRKAVSVEMVELYKDEKDINGTQSSSVYDANYWSAVSDRVNKTIQCTDADEDGYVQFNVENRIITKFVYKTKGITLTYQNGGSWTVS